MSVYATTDDLAAALGGERHLIEFFVIGPNDSAFAIAAFIAKACDRAGITVGKEDDRPWTLSVTVADLADRIASIRDLQPAPPVRPATIPTIGTFEALSSYLRGLTA